MIPSHYPNRAVRRAVKQNRMSRLSADWRHYLAVYPQVAKAIRAL